MHEPDIRAMLAKGYWTTLGNSTPSPAELAQLTLNILNLNGFKIVETDANVRV